MIVNYFCAQCGNDDLEFYSKVKFDDERQMFITQTVQLRRPYCPHCKEDVEFRVAIMEDAPPILQ